MQRFLIVLLMAVAFSLNACTVSENTVEPKQTDERTSLESVDESEDVSSVATGEDGTSVLSDDTKLPSGEESNTEVPSDDEGEDDDYLQLSARNVEAFRRRFFSFSQSEMLLYLNLPDDWELMAGESVEEYRILREGVEIGTLTKGGKQGSSDWKLLDTDISYGGTVLSEHYLEKDGTGDTLRFRHRYYFRFAENDTRRIVTLTIAYAELDESSARTVFAEAGAISRRMLDPGLGTLTEAQWGSIAILGNSFISSSRIGGILSDMLVQNGKACYVNAISRGYAHIDTYVNDPTIMGEIESGTYDVVFICGVNSTAKLGELLDACALSDTTLMILPAHNEPSGDLERALIAYPDVRIMDWKGEIDALIAAGGDKWDFCIKDEHLHSTPLAGYVGAHMIYRAIWGEIPTGEMAYGVTQEEIDRVLGDYAKTGVIIDVNEEDVLVIG